MLQQRPAAAAQSFLPCAVRVLQQSQVLQHAWLTACRGFPGWTGASTTTAADQPCMRVSEPAAEAATQCHELLHQQQPAAAAAVALASMYSLQLAAQQGLNTQQSPQQQRQQQLTCGQSHRHSSSSRPHTRQPSSWQMPGVAAAGLTNCGLLAPRGSVTAHSCSAGLFWGNGCDRSSSSSGGGILPCRTPVAVGIGRCNFSSSSSSRDYQLDPIHSVSYEDIASGNIPTVSTTTTSSRAEVVAVAVSGGVDSAVSAMLLKRMGYRVFGVYMHNWDPADEAGSCTPTCTSAADLEDARLVCAALQMPLYEADFVSKYWNSVFSHFLEGLEQGLTPNPDLACNSHIKFGALLEFARERGADVLATGHYARLGWRAASAGLLSSSSSCSACTGGSGSDSFGAAAAGTQQVAAAAHADGATQQQQQQQQQQQPVLLKGADALKDQSYFLAGLNQQQLARAMFPVGHLTKAHVRQIAAAAGLPIATKRSSAGICFIGRRSFGRFLEDYLPPQPGVYVDVDTGRALGRCSNMLAVTVGQRALGLGGQQERVYVAGKHMEAGVVHVARGHDHPALFSTAVLLQPPDWISGSAGPAGQGTCQHAAAAAAAVVCTDSDSSSSSAGRLICSYKARYRQPAAACSLRPLLAGEQFQVSRFCWGLQGAPPNKQVLHAQQQQQQQQQISLGQPAAAAVDDGSGGHKSSSSSHSSSGMVLPNMTVARPALAVGAAVALEDSELGLQAGAAPVQQHWVAELAEPLRGITPGQMFVLYDGEVCLGSAVIAAHGSTLAE